MEVDRSWLCGPGAEHPAVAIIAERFPQAQLEREHFRGEIVWTVEPGSLLEFMGFIRDDERLQFKFLSDVGGVEYKNVDPLLWTFYNVHSLVQRVRMRIKVPARGDKVPSITGLYPGANWHEREAYDMYGIVFEGHPDLTRIFMPDDFDGHPLRKDFPLRGRE